MTEPTVNPDFTPSTLEVEVAYNVAGMNLDTYRESFQRSGHRFSPEFHRWLAQRDAESFLLGVRRARDAAFQPYPGLGWESSVEKIDAVIAACENSGASE